MMILDLIWLALVAVTMFIVPRRHRQATIALACVLALLFPIISASDDFSADRVMIESAAVAIVCVLLLAFIALVALGRIERESERPAILLLATPSDPRSPPRR
jgi:amino acid transporter